MVLSLYGEADREAFSKDFAKKIAAGGIRPEDIGLPGEPDGINLAKTAISYSDAVIFGSADVDGGLKAHCDALGLPVLPYSEQSFEGGSYVDEYDRFYDQL